MYSKNLLSFYLLFFISISLFSISTAKAGGCKETFSISHSHKDTTWDNPSIINDSLIINPGDTIHLNWSLYCLDDAPESVIGYWYKDGMLLKTNTFGGSFEYGGKDSLLITGGGVYKLEVPILGRTYTITISDNALGVFNPLSSFTNIEIYPNPVSDILNIRFKAQEPSKLSYFIYNDIGQPVKTGEVSADVVKNNELNIEELNAGLYTMLIRYNNTQQTSRFVKN